MKFRLLRGIHIHGDKHYSPEPGNNIVESDSDLAAKFGREKFERIVEPEPAKSESKPSPPPKEDPSVREQLVKNGAARELARHGK